MTCEQKKSPEALNLMPVYLSYIHYMHKPDGNFRNFLSIDRAYIDEVCSEDCFGRTIWALGFLIKHSPSSSYREFDNDIFRSAIHHFEKLETTRGVANTLIGVAYVLKAYPSDERMFAILAQLSGALVGAYKINHDYKWDWFEDGLSYDNAILPLALFHAGEITGDPEIKRIAQDSLRFLERLTFKNGYFTPVGNDGWYHRDDGKVPVYDQQAIETMGMVLLYFQAYESTQNPEYIRKMFACYMWFHGENTLRVPLYDHETKGCCDGLQPHGINRNQGAESTLAYMISHLTVLKAFELEYEYSLPIENIESLSGS
jgi:hypothetical protein